MTTQVFILGNIAIIIVGIIIAVVYTAMRNRRLDREEKEREAKR